MDTDCLADTWRRDVIFCFSFFFSISDFKSYHLKNIIFRVGLCRSDFDHEAIMTFSLKYKMRLLTFVVTDAENYYYQNFSHLMCLL